MDFQTFFTQKLKEQGLTLKKVSELTGITLKHLENLNCGNWTDLPAAPYLRGYFLKLGEALEFDGEEAWNYFRREVEVSTSGSEDTLPKNCFLKRSSTRKIVLIAGAAVILIILLSRIPQILGRPDLTLVYPTADLTTSNTKEIIISGEIKGGDKVLVNGDEVVISETGTWQQKINLDPGLNSVEIIGEKFLGQEIKIIKQVVYEEPPNTGTKNETSTSTEDTNSEGE
jgi:hypothetical protein